MPTTEMNPNAVQPLKAIVTQYEAQWSESDLSEAQRLQLAVEIQRNQILAKLLNVHYPQS